MTKNSRKSSSKQRTILLFQSISPLYLVVGILILLLMFSILLNVKLINIINGIAPVGIRNIPGLEDFIYKAEFPRQPPSPCIVQERGQPTNGYRTYIVRKGDTLLSIARDQLNDTSRVNEIINLNSGIYPQLSLQNPFLEVGWKLYLTPSNFPRTSGRVTEEKGKIIDMNSTNWYIMVSTRPASPPYDSFTITDITFINKPRQLYRIGDCVNIFVDEGTSPLSTIITPQ